MLVLSPPHWIIIAGAIYTVCSKSLVQLFYYSLCTNGQDFLDTQCQRFRGSKATPGQFSGRNVCPRSLVLFYSTLNVQMDKTSWSKLAKIFQIIQIFFSQLFKDFLNKMCRNFLNRRYSGPLDCKWLEVFQFFLMCVLSICIQ